jgi:hypothetical protein
MGVNWKACLVHTFLHHSLALTLLCPHPSFIWHEHSMTLSFGVDINLHYCCHAFNCSDNTGNVRWWKVSEVCCMDCIRTCSTAYSSVQYFSVWHPRISYIPDSFRFVYVFLFNINLQHRCEISFIYNHKYVTLLHHVSLK